MPLAISALAAAEETTADGFASIDVAWWHWAMLLAVIVVLLLVDLLVVHREAHEVTTTEAVIESVVWIGCGLGFSLLIWWWFGGAATGEYVSGYLIEKSLSIDNVFVWALIMGYFSVPPRYQHRVLFWGVFGALLMRAAFIFAGVAAIERFGWVLYIFGAFLLYTAGKLIFTDNDHVDPGDSVFLKLIGKFVRTSNELDGQRLFTKIDGHHLATPLFSVLLLVEVTDVAFAVDSVPAVLAISREPFIVFASNAFAILGLRALYFLLADMHHRFVFLQQGLAIILALVGIKMLIHTWYQIPTPVTLVVIAVVLVASIGFSLQIERVRADGALVREAFRRRKPPPPPPGH